MSGEGRGLTKWQVAALGVGAVAVVAGGALVAYACVKRRRRHPKKEDDREGTPENQGARSGTGSQSAATSHPASQPVVSGRCAGANYSMVSLVSLEGVQYLESGLYL